MRARCPECCRRHDLERVALRLAVWLFLYGLGTGVAVMLTIAERA